MKYLYMAILFLLIGCGTENTPVYQLTTSAEPTEAGTVSPSGGEFDSGTSVTFTATPNEHWVFSGWQSGLSGNNNPDSLEINSDTHITALFVKKDYPLTVTALGNGVITERVVQAKTTDYQHGTIVELTAEPNEDFWTFQSWTGDIESTENPVTVEVGGPTQVQGIFQINTYTINTSVNGTGTVEISPEKNEFDHGEEVTVTATGDPGWRFTDWGGDITSNENPLIFTIGSDTDLTANFEEATYSLVINTTGDGAVIYSPDKESYSYGDQVSMQARPSGNNVFIRWQGDLESTEPQETITMEKDTDVTAVFRSVEESLSQRYVSMSSINNRVLNAGIQLENNLGDDVTLTRFTVFNQSGGQVARNNEEHVIKPGESIGYSLSFNIPPLRSVVSTFEAEWRVTYKGENYTKRAPFGDVGSVNKQPTDHGLIKLEAILN